MRNISQEEFEMIICELINGRITKVKAVRDLKTDIRTLNNKITELAEKNPKLYEEYVERFPYHTKSRENIDFEALIIHAMKYGKNLENVSAEYDVSIRTISRRIKELEKTNPKFIELYRTYAYYIKTGKEIPYDFQEKIDQLEERAIILSGITEKKKEKLNNTLNKFQELLKSNPGMSKAEAARKLGYDGYPTIWKKQQELERIEAEEKVISSKVSDSRKFRQSMRTTESNNNGEENKLNARTQKYEKEGR